MGNQSPISDSAAPIKNENGQTFGVVMVFRDVSKEQEQKHQILYLSNHDYLTGIYNRRFIEEEIKRLDTAEQLPLTLIMGDLNGLKLTNDVFGHIAGDKLIKKAAEVLTENCLPEGIVARWGGDEFLALLPHTTAEQAEKIVQSIKLSCSVKSESALQLSISLGYAVKAKKGESIIKVLKESEEWMYRQKLKEGKDYRNTLINTLLATLFEKSIEAEEHAERLGQYCNIMGKKLNLSSKELNELDILSRLHDIGKVAIHESILNKPGPLSEEEWDEMRKHPEIGYRIAHNTPELSAVSEYILSHHERWDGKGYPRGIKEDEIPLLCRILTVADAFDAMTSDRVYRKAISKEMALDELKNNAGTQFDPEIADIFALLMECSVIYPFNFG